MRAFSEREETRSEGGREGEGGLPAACGVVRMAKKVESWWAALRPPPSGLRLQRRTTVRILRNFAFAVRPRARPA